MSKNVSLMGADYPDVPAVVLPKTGGGSATFTDVSDTTASAADVKKGKMFYDSSGNLQQGTLDIDNNTYTAPTNIHQNASVIAGGYCEIGKIVIVNCRFSISSNIGTDVAIAKFPTPSIQNATFISLTNNKNQDIIVANNGNISSSDLKGTGTGTLIVSGVYMKQ